MDKGGWQNKGAGHRGRLRDKFLEVGIDAFTDAEIIEVLLTFGTPRSDCKKPARDLLTKFGSLSAVLEESVENLTGVSGVGPKNVFALRFIHAVSRRFLQKRLREKEYLHSSKDVRDYLTHSLRDLKNEVLSVVYLDSQHAVIDTEIVCEGTINVNTVYPREIVNRCLGFNAAALIIAHNHPSGSIKPSKQDHELTKILFMTCRLMQIRLLDHLIVGETIYSFADNGLMREIQQTCETLIR